MFTWLARWRRRKLDDPYQRRLFLRETLTVVREYDSGEELRRRIYEDEEGESAGVSLGSCVGGGRLQARR